MDEELSSRWVEEPLQFLTGVLFSPLEIWTTDLNGTSLHDTILCCCVLGLEASFSFLPPCSFKLFFIIFLHFSSPAALISSLQVVMPS
jgi:hypothetical protein